MSQHFAVAQALEWCERVVAVVPRSYAIEKVAIESARARQRDPDTRLVAAFHLPRSVFRDEGAEVDVSVLLWRETAIDALVREVTIEQWPIGPSHPVLALGLPALHHEGWEVCTATLQPIDTPPDLPATLLPVTGDREVVLAHDGRRVHVKATCAAAHVQAMNALLLRADKDHDMRRVRKAKYEGQGALDVETLLAQPDTHLAVQSVLDRLRAVGLDPRPDEGFARYFARRVRQQAIDVTPFGHEAFIEDGGFADWLFGVKEASVRPKPDTYSRGEHYFSEPGATRTCTSCAGKGTLKYRDGLIDCHVCDGTGIEDVSSRRECLRVLDQVYTARRCPPPYKEEKKSKWWEVSLDLDGGRDDDGNPIVKCGWGTREVWSEAEFLRAFDFVEFQPYKQGWTHVHAPLASLFPAAYEARMRRAIAEGCDKWLWSYQLHDLCEIGMKRGAIIAWEMGLGKARLAAALCLTGGKHNLITVETRLLREMEAEFKAIGLPRDTWQTITKPEQLYTLRRINLISYDKLKSALPGKKRPKPPPQPEGAPPKKVRTFDVRHTFASALRRRIHTHVCDEGHLLAHDSTQQSRAVWHVSAKGKRYLLTGTPISNYPRDVLRLLQWVAGDGTARQIYGAHWPLMRTANLVNTLGAPRGVDTFREYFVTLRWVTSEFTDEMREGAKREIPIIADVPRFRHAVGPHIKRRVSAEPDVQRHIQIPKAEYIDTIVDWDTEHLAYYKQTSDDFVHWYTREQEKLTGNKRVPLQAVLAKIQAVAAAANYPQGGVSGQPDWTGGPTSKQRFAVARLREWVDAGKRSIFLTERPALVDQLADHFTKLGIEAVPFHGGIPIKKRVDSLDSRFRKGDAPILLATKRVLQTGYNIAEACRVLFYDGTWTPMVEHQAAARVLRPQQRNEVVIERLQLRGSIDEYQRQMVDSKSLAARSGLDYGAGPPDDMPFAHIDVILQRFVADLAPKGETK
jgi:hypothetical protein